MEMSILYWKHRLPKSTMFSFTRLPNFLLHISQVDERIHHLHLHARLFNFVTGARAVLSEKLMETNSTLLYLIGLWSC
jgi:hypothetical protein